MSYGWPVEPFDEQHPVRGFFCDPRIEGASRAFHFGIDVSAPDGTPVYAVRDGTVYSSGGDRLAVLGAIEHAYWHIVPSVRAGQEVKRHALLGHIAEGWGHVHLAERRDRRYWNPLRRRALTPFDDYGAPVVGPISVERAGLPLDPAALTADIDLIVEAHDNPPISAPPPWRGLPVTPALVRWRVLRAGRTIVPWTVAADFRATLVPSSHFAAVYAPGTRQNHPDRPGRYRFWLTRGWNTRTRPDGRYRLEVEASDTRGNGTRKHLDIVLVNQSV